MNRYLIRITALGSGLALIFLSSVIGQSAGLVALIVSTFLFSFGTVASMVVLVLTALDLGGPA